jgi:hypothetical protein
VRGSESNPNGSGDLLLDAPQELGKVDARLQALAIRIHIMPQEDDLIISGGYESSDFLEYLLSGTTFLSPSQVGNHAIGAEIIAALHNLDPCFEPVETERDNRLLLLRGVPLFSQQRWDLGNLIDSYYEIHEREAQPQTLSLLLRDTPADPHLEKGLPPLQDSYSPQLTEEFLLRFLPNGTGIQDDQVGFFFLLGQEESLSGENTRYLFRIELIGLAPEGNQFEVWHSSLTNTGTWGTSIRCS